MWRDKHRRKGFLIAVVSACLPAALIGMLVYILGTQKIETEAKKTHQNQVAYATERIDNNLSHLESTMAQWSFNLTPQWTPATTDSSTFSNLDIEKDYTNVHTLYKALTWIKASDPLIEDAKLYLDKQEVVIQDNAGIRRVQSAEELRMYRSLASYQRDIYWTELTTKNPNSAPFMLVVRLPGGLVQTEAALIVEINAKQLNRLIAELVPEGGGATLLLQDEGKLISLGNRKEASKLDRLLAAEIPVGATEPTSIITRWEGETYSVSYGTMKRIGRIWTVATATPLSQMTEPVQALSRFIIYTGLLGLMLAFLLSWFAYRQMMEPIRRLVNQLLPGRSVAASDHFDMIAQEWAHLSGQSRVLRERLNQQLPNLRESFLLQLVQGHLYFLMEEELVDRMERYEWLVRGRSFSLLGVQMHGLYRNEGKFSEGDEQLVTFAAQNIAEELAKTKGLDCSVVNFQDMTIGLFVRHPADQPFETSRSSLYPVAEELAATLYLLLRVDIAVCVGRQSAALRDIPFLFSDVRNALGHRRLNEPQQVMDVEDVIPGGREPIPYPSELEHAILQAMRMGAEEELSLRIDEFLAALQSQSGKEMEVRHGLLQLLGSMQNTILHAGYSPLEVFGGNELWEQLQEQRDPEAFARWLKRRVAKSYVRQLHETQNMQLKQLVERVLGLIHRGYMTDLSLESCADAVGTYPKKLSVSFKQVTGQTFIDYLTEYRLNHAKKLLEETDEKINDIAAQVGYQPPYFNRLFKKIEGITPGQYREKLNG